MTSTLLRIFMLSLFLIGNRILTIAQNLVPNPSFETLSDCDLYLNEFQKVNEWKGYHFTPDIFHSCSESPLMSVPNNVYDSQMAATGKAYAGILTWHRDFDNELIGAKLLQKLRKGQKYRVSMKVSHASTHSQYVANSLGILFTNSPDNAFNCNQAHFFIREVITESDIWATYTSEIEANEDYQYIMIGNFFQKEKTLVQKTGGGMFPAAFYFIDDIAVYPVQQARPLADENKNQNPANSNFNTQKLITISGNVFDAETKKPLVAEVEYIVPFTKIRFNDLTGLESGYYTFVKVPFSSDFFLQIKARNYYPITQTFKGQLFQNLKKDFYLHPLKAGEQIEVQNIEFKRENRQLKPESLPELNKLAQILTENPTMKVKITVYTENQEQFKLAEERAGEIKNYLVTMGKVKTENVLTSAKISSLGLRNATSAAADERSNPEKIELTILN